MMRKYVAIAALLVLGACEGSNQKAGEAQDKAAANAAGVPYTGDGPAERLGKAKDEADRAAKDAKAGADRQLKAEQHEIKTQADVAADRLDEQADKIRKDAKARAEALQASSPNQH